MDNIFKIVQVPKIEAGDIQLGKNLEEEVKSALTILHQNDHKAENLDIDVNADEAKAKDNDFV